MKPLVMDWHSFFAVQVVIIIVRLKDEEDLLTREWSGYAEYQQKVHNYPIYFVRHYGREHF